jgi:hypothetical protein
MLERLLKIAFVAKIVEFIKRRMTKNKEGR